MIKEGALGGARGVHDLIQAAALEAVLEELRERGIEELSPGGFGCLHGPYIQTGRYVVKNRLRIRFRVANRSSARDGGAVRNKGHSSARGSID
jgi:hypothetical protein